MSQPPPSFESLLILKDRFETAQIVYALGGSGLLAFLKLKENTNDWDLTTDAPWEKVELAVQGLHYNLIPPDKKFASGFLCRVKIAGSSIDIIGNFGIITPDGIHRVRTVVTGLWKGIPLGSPKEWALAYEYMGRFENAQLLKLYLQQMATF